jgi:hypothetical protein
MQCTSPILYYHLWPVWLHHIFPHNRINGMVFGKMLLNMKCVFWFSLQRLFEKFIILTRIRWGNIINVHRSSFQVPVIFVRFSSILSFLYKLSKNPQISDFMIVRPDAELFIRLDARTYITQLTVALAVLRTREKVSYHNVDAFCHSSKMTWTAVWWRN